MPEESLWVRLQEAARPRTDQVYCTWGENEYTVGEVLDRANVVGNRLRRRGLLPGARVVVMLPNSMDHVFLIFGLLAAGLVYVPINVRTKGPGLEHILAQVEPEMVVAHVSVLDALSGAIDATGFAGARLWLDDEASDTEVRALVGAGFDRTEARPSGSPHSDGDQVVCISYTSGTTGPPKGVQVTGNMLLGCARAVGQATELRPDDTFLVWEPFYHVGGHQVLILGLIEPLRLAILPRFSASTFWHEARRHGATHIHYLGGVLQILLRQPSREDDRAHSVRVAWGAGATGDAWGLFVERFGVELREVYGLTETSSINAINATNRAGSMGLPSPGFTLEVIDSERRPVPAGTTGEIRMRSADPTLFTPGYFRNAAATSQLIPGDGWLYTGDSAHADIDGYLYFDGRLTDNVRVSGENVSAWEVETVARDHPDISDCAMVGVASEMGEQDIKLIVQRVEGASLTEEDVVNWCAERLGPHQVPRYIEWIPGFSRTPSMRIQKHGLSKSSIGCWDRYANQQEAKEDQ